jgi:hypothetical protein
VDFAFPIAVNPISIYSSQKPQNILGTALTGIFDDISFGLAIFAAIAMTVLVWLTMRNGFARFRIGLKCICFKKTCIAKKKKKSLQTRG